MKNDSVKENILYIMRADCHNTPKNVNRFLTVLTQTDEDDSSLDYFIELYRALESLEAENLVEDVTGTSRENFGILEKIKKSKWHLKEKANAPQS